MTKNITLAIDEELLERFRLHAVHRKTSVNALLRKHMEDSVGLEERRRSAIAGMLKMGRETKSRINMNSWNREASYDHQGED